MKIFDKEVKDSRIAEWKALVAGSMVFGSMIYGYTALRENAELNIQKPPNSKAIRNERLMRMASKSCLGGIKISAFLTTYLALDFGLEYIRNNKPDNVVNKITSGGITGLLFSLRGGPAVALQGSIIGAGLSYAFVMAKDTFKIIDEVIKEPLGGAHRDYDKSLTRLGDSIESQLNELLKLDPQELKIIKQNKYLKIT